MKSNNKTVMILVAVVVVLLLCITCMLAYQVGSTPVGPTATAWPPTVTPKPTATTDPLFTYTPAATTSSGSQVTRISDNWQKIDDNSGSVGIGTFALKTVEVNGKPYDFQLLVICKNGKDLGIGLYTNGLFVQADKTALSFIGTDTMYSTNIPENLIPDDEAVAWLKPFADTDGILRDMTLYNTLLVAGFDTNDNSFGTAFDITGFREAAKDVYKACGQ